jgi:hypothetical protein
MQPGGVVLVHNEPIPHEISTFELNSKTRGFVPIFELSFQIENVWSNFFSRQNCSLIFSQVALSHVFTVTIQLFFVMILDRRVTQRIFLNLYDFQARAVFPSCCQIQLTFSDK